MPETIARTRSAHAEPPTLRERVASRRAPVAAGLLALGLVGIATPFLLAAEHRATVAHARLESERDVSWQRGEPAPPARWPGRAAFGLGALCLVAGAAVGAAAMGERRAGGR